MVRCVEAVGVCVWWYALCCAGLTVAECTCHAWAVEWQGHDWEFSWLVVTFLDAGVASELWSVCVCVCVSYYSPAPVPELTRNSVELNETKPISCLQGNSNCSLSTKYTLWQARYQLVESQARMLFTELCEWVCKRERERENELSTTLTQEPRHQQSFSISNNAKTIIETKCLYCKKNIPVRSVKMDREEEEDEEKEEEQEKEAAAAHFPYPASWRGEGGRGGGRAAAVAVGCVCDINWFFFPVTLFVG